VKERLLTALTACLLGTAAAQAGETATATVGEPLPAPASLQALGGYNYGNFMTIGPVYQWLRPANPRSLRFPGGNTGDDNDLLPQLPGLEVARKLLNPSEFIISTRAFATRPTSKNKPEDAAEAVREVARMGIPVAYWGVGNEPDLYATNRGDKTWTVEKYCQTFRAHREAILKVDPKARMAGPSISGSLPAQDFLVDFVKLCGDAVDLLTWHIYPSAGELTDEKALETVSRANDDVAKFRALLKDPEKNPLGYQRQVELGVTEYGLSWKTNNYRHLADMVAALWAAETTMRLAEGGVKVASYFALTGTGGHGLLDTAGIPRPTWYAFRQLAAFKGQPLAVTSSDPALWVHGARDGKLTTLLVSNTATTAKDFTAQVPGAAVIGAKTFTEETVKNEDEFIRLATKPSLQLPARSLTRIVLKEGASE
jgi:hypothetical protein